MGKGERTALCQNFSYWPVLGHFSDRIHSFYMCLSVGLWHSELGNTLSHRPCTLRGSRMRFSLGTAFCDDTFGLGLGLGPCVTSMILASQGKAGGKATSWCPFLSPSNWCYGVLLAHLENIASYLKRQRRAWKTPRPIWKQPYSGMCKGKKNMENFVCSWQPSSYGGTGFISHTAKYSVD